MAEQVLSAADAVYGDADGVILIQNADRHAWQAGFAAVLQAVVVLVEPGAIADRNGDIPARKVVGWFAAGVIDLPGRVQPVFGIDSQRTWATITTYAAAECMPGFSIPAGNVMGIHTLRCDRRTGAADIQVAIAVKSHGIDGWVTLGKRRGYDSHAKPVPGGSIPHGNVVDFHTARFSQPPTGVQVTIVVGDQRFYGILRGTGGVDAASKLMPGSSIPHGNVVGSYSSGLGKAAAGIYIPIFIDSQCIYITCYAIAQGMPGSAIPHGDAVGRHTAGG